MYLVDANILLYAVNENTPSHTAAQDWLDDKLGGPTQTVGLPWPTLLAFVRVATNPRVYARPMPVKEAWGLVEDWLNQRAAWIPVAGPRHRHVLGTGTCSAG
jgi:toxin-antitoxin system PIN domain toxin